MNFLKTFKEKIAELERAENSIFDIKRELSIQANKIQHEILDLVNEINLNKINVDVNVNNKNIHIILCKYAGKSDLQDVMIIWENNGTIKSNYQQTLLNFNAGGNTYYLELAEILKYLINTYPEEYEKAKMKKETNKFNI